MSFLSPESMYLLVVWWYSYHILVAFVQRLSSFRMSTTRNEVRFVYYRYLRQPYHPLSRCFMLTHLTNLFSLFSLRVIHNGVQDTHVRIYNNQQV